ncbi:MAG: EF-P lysine aminoacylase GenX [Gammaproteobacteria bacterium]|nr:EF-P lysine aminoacylase GenX [Gammaproteobacteria bacterium]
MCSRWIHVRARTSAGRRAPSGLTDWGPSASIATLVARAAALADVRGFFARRGVIEIDTPVLGRTTVTDPAIDSLAVDVASVTHYLQTSPEYHLKRLLAAGAPCVARIGPVFRADEAGRLHNPEFTMIEWYRLGIDLNALMDETAALVDCVMGQAGHQRISYAALLEGVGVDVFSDSMATLVGAALESGAAGDVAAWSRRALLDYFTALALRRISGRVFVTQYPPDQAALARLVDDPAGRPVAARFELVIDGVEIANGYDELTDANVLAARMAADRDARALNSRPAYAADARLLAAMRAGLPSCCGVAVGFDRLFMLARGETRLAAVLPFSFDRA